MHLGLLLVVIALSWVSRCYLRGTGESGWQKALVNLVLPPLLCLTTAWAILLMGHHGLMWGVPVSGVACQVALGITAIFAWCCLREGWQSWQLHHWLAPLPLRSLEELGLPLSLQQTLQTQLPQTRFYYVPTPNLLAGQVGVWRSRILLSQGMIEQLTIEQLQAVVYHEQAHFYYRDPLLFPLFASLRSVLGWLPGTQSLWQQLALWRECRADRWAAQFVDPLLLAETLVAVVQASHPQGSDLSPLAAFDSGVTHSGLGVRVQSLLTVDVAQIGRENDRLAWILWGLGGAGCLPLLSLGFHQMAL